MKYILLIFFIIIALPACADEYICLVDKITGEATNFYPYTQKNQSTWENLKGDKELKIVEVSAKILNAPYKKWNGETIIIDTVKIAEAQKTADIQTAIQYQAQIDAAMKLYDSATKKNKADYWTAIKDLQAKVDAIEAKETP